MESDLAWALTHTLTVRCLEQRIVSSRSQPSLPDMHRGRSLSAMVDIDLPIPSLLLDLVERGIWSADSSQSERFEMAYAPNGPQHDTVDDQRRRLKDYGPPRVPVDRIHLIYPGQSVLCLYPPPTGVRTVQPQARHWGMFEGYLVEHEIDRTRLLRICDFGWGADCVIVLDYQIDLHQPTVCRLTPQVGSPDPHGNYRYKIASIEIARSFDEFARLLRFIE